MNKYIRTYIAVLTISITFVVFFGFTGCASEESPDGIGVATPYGISAVITDFGKNVVGSREWNDPNISEYGDYSVKDQTFLLQTDVVYLIWPYLLQKGGSAPAGLNSVNFEFDEEFIEFLPDSVPSEYKSNLVYAFRCVKSCENTVLRVENTFFCEINIKII